MTDENSFGERIVKIETDVQYIKESVLEIKQILVQNEQRYAAKWVENAMKVVVYVVGVAVLGALLGLVIVKGG